MSKRILIADDEEQWRLSVSAVVKKLGHHCTTTTNRREAEKKLESDTFDLVITDNNMGWRDAGIGLLAHLRLMGNNVPVIIHSGDLTYMSQEECKKLSGVYVTKSYGPANKLIEIIRELVGE